MQIRDSQAEKVKNKRADLRLNDLSVKFGENQNENTLGYWLKNFLGYEYHPKNVIIFTLTLYNNLSVIYKNVN